MKNQLRVAESEEKMNAEKSIKSASNTNKPAFLRTRENNVTVQDISKIRESHAEDVSKIKNATVSDSTVTSNTMSAKEDKDLPSFVKTRNRLFGS